ncbi:MAG: LysM peptidoglycan-binding domain-containing protein [Spirochaetales bacterium]|nr:LysM peptidoglycan-binding domain-containing protein [Spirochaetales bacterium]
MKKNWIYVTLILVMLILAGCTSDPETTPEEPVEETVTEEPELLLEEPEETPAPEEPVATAEPVSAEEIKAAEDAVERADLAGAKTYAADKFLEANEKLEEARTLSESDPDKSRELLGAAVSKADEAYRLSVDSQVAEKVAKLRLLEKQLNDIEAEKYAPDDFKIVKERADLLVSYLNNEEYEKADKQYHSTLRAMQNLYDTIDNNIRWVKILDRDTQAYMSDAEEKEAFLWAPEELEKANYNYSDGLSYFHNYNLSDSEKSLKEAKYWAFTAIRLSEKRKRLSQTDELMMSALEELEKASRNRVIESDGTIREASPWEGGQFIDENPAESTRPDEFSDDGSSLKEYNPDEQLNDENAMIIDGETTVLGDEQEMTLLEQAIELWKQGVKARAEGKYDIADEYFKQSKAYSEAYSANAVANEYIVKKRDTLWAISAMKEHLGDPFLWTKIWRRNSLIIENPDLIYPGQKLIIPPK